jgi:hypothetical protein
MVACTLVNTVVMVDYALVSTVVEEYVDFLAKNKSSK